MAAAVATKIRYPHLAVLGEGRPGETAVTVTLNRPSYHGRTEFTLRLGRIDADAIEFFGFAKCHLLASAMHELTGWPFAVVHQFVDGEWKWAHAGVVTTAGLFLDIHGTRAFSEVTAKFEGDYGHRVRISSHDSYEQCHAAILPGAVVAPWTDQANPLGVELVRHFADQLVGAAEVST